MICSKCGAPKNEDDDFCRKCGYKFSREAIDDYKDSYQINVAVSTIIGLCSGILTGIFSAALSQTIILELWGWGIVLIVVGGFCGLLMYDSFNTIKKSSERQMRRR